MSASEPILTLSDVVSGYGKMTILNGTSASIRRGAITTVIGPNGAGKSTMFKTAFGLLGVRSGRIDVRRPRYDQLLAAADARCRHVLRAAGPQHLPGAVGAAQPGARRRGARRPVAACRSASTPMMQRFPDPAGEGECAGLHALGRPAEAARGRARPAARSQAHADRRAVHRPLADAGAGGVRHPRRSCATRASPSC